MSKLKTYIQIDPTTREVINIIQTDNTEIHESYISIADSNLAAKKEGFVLVFDNKTSTVKNVADLRGKIIYNKITQEEQEQEELGDIDENFTLLAPASIFDEFDEKSGKWVKNAEKEKTYTIEKIQTALMNLCDSKQKDAKKLILGYKATPAQEERYKYKYAQAQKYRDDKAFKPSFDEIKDTESAITIIDNFERSEAAILAFVNMIELFRGCVADLIAEEKYEQAEVAIEAAADFGTQTSKAEILKLFKNL